MTEESNGWGAWGKYVLKTIEKLEDRISGVEEHQRDNEIDIVKINVKAGVVAGCITLIISTILSIAGGVIVYKITRGEFKDFKKTNIELTEQVENNKEIVKKYKILINKENKDVGR